MSSCSCLTALPWSCLARFAHILAGLCTTFFYEITVSFWLFHYCLVILYVVVVLCMRDALAPNKNRKEKRKGRGYGNEIGDGEGIDRGMMDTQNVACIQSD